MFRLQTETRGAWSLTRLLVMGAGLIASVAPKGAAAAVVPP